MKTFNRSSLPDTIKYNGINYVYNPMLSASLSNGGNPSLSTIKTQLKLQNRSAVMVKVLSAKLKGKKDFHGNKYQPTKYLFDAILN